MQMAFYDSSFGVAFTAPPSQVTGKYALVIWEHDNEKRWCEDAGNVWIEPRFGSRHYKKPGDCVFETAEADDWMLLDWSKTDLLDPNCDAGWLSPEGRFYGCRYARHDAVAELILRKPVAKLDAEGWVRVAGREAILYTSRFPTERQRAWASNNGHFFDCDIPVKEF